MRRAPVGVRRWAMVAALAGAALALAVVARIGFGEVVRGVERIGWRGLGVLVAWSALPYALLGLAWFILVPHRPLADLPRFIAARVVRDSTGELLPFTPIGGFAAGARAAVLMGLEATIALAATIADVTCELIAQLGFTALGVLLLARRLGAHLGREAVLEAALAGLALSAAGAAGFVAFQRRGWPAFGRLAGRLSAPAGRRIGAVGESLERLYEPPLRVGLAVATHLAAWIASAAGVWLALRIAGARVGPAAILALEALIYAVRSAAFVAPMGAGVQEATYALIGPIFGLPAELAVAVSLIKRARDLVIGLPALGLWQAVESGRALRRRRRGP